GVDDYSACEDASDCFRQLGWVEDPVLEQVADSSFAALEQTERVLGLDVLREDEQRYQGEAGADLCGGAQALVAVAWRQRDVDQDDVRLHPLDQVEQILNRFRLAYDVEISFAQDSIETLANQQRVFGDHHASRSRRRRRRMCRIVS